MPAPPSPPPLRGRFLTDDLSRAAYAEGAGIYRIVPRAVALPADLEDLARLVRWAGESGVALVPRGAGSGMPGGNVGTGVVVDLTAGFRGPIERTGDRRLGVPAGRTCAELAEAARPLGLRLPVDPASMAFCTVGGMVATNAAGPRSRRYGSVRRWIEAVEAVFVDGSVRTVRRGSGKGEGGSVTTLSDAERDAVRRSFPKTRKNSSGYALDAFLASGDELDLLIGSEGTLAIVTGVEVRLDPTPPDASGLLVGLPSLDDLLGVVTFLDALNPSAVELLDRTFLDLIRAAARLKLPDGLEAVLVVEFERDIADQAHDVVREAARGLGARVAHLETAIDRRQLERLFAVRQMASPALAQLPETRHSLQLVEDGCVPLESLGRYVAGVRSAAERAAVPVAIFGHAGDGHVHVNALPDLTRPDWRERLARLFREVTELLVSLGGTPSGEHGDGRLRSGLLARVYGDAVVALFAQVKRHYDPAGVLNPGVIIPAPDWDPLRDLKVGADAAPIPDAVARRLRDLERTAGWSLPKWKLAR